MLTVSNIDINVNRCTNSTSDDLSAVVCKSDEEIDAKIDDIALIMVYNNEMYMPEAYGDEFMIEKAVKIERFPFDRLSRPYYRQRSVQMSEIDSDDFLFSSLNSWTNQFESYSIVESSENVRFTKNWDSKGFIGGLNLGGNPNLIMHSRAIYTFLDLLGDIGGLIDSLKLIGYSMIVFFTSGKYSSFLINKLFYSSNVKLTRENDYMISMNPNLLNNSSPLQTEKAVELAMNKRKIKFKSNFISCCDTRRKKILEKGEEKLSTQMDIVKFLKRQIIFDILLKAKLTNIERYLARR